MGTTLRSTKNYLGFSGYINRLDRCQFWLGLRSKQIFSHFDLSPILLVMLTSAADYIKELHDFNVGEGSLINIKVPSSTNKLTFARMFASDTWSQDLPIHKSNLDLL